jgi:hypothetical protein
VGEGRGDVLRVEGEEENALAELGGRVRRVAVVMMDMMGGYWGR